MFLLKDDILDSDDCESIIKSIKRFTKAKLYYNGDKGVKKSVYIPSQRNALSKDIRLLKGTNLYDKIDNSIRKTGYKLKSEDLKCSVIKYKNGHFIHKHKDGGEIFMTCVIQLTEPSKYQGGEFIYWVNGVEHILKKELGHGVIIGPEVEHEVKIITKGERKSLVLFLYLDDVESLTKQSLI